MVNCKIALSSMSLSAFGFSSASTRSVTSTPDFASLASLASGVVMGICTLPYSGDLPLSRLSRIVNAILMTNVSRWIMSSSFIAVSWTAADLEWMTIVPISISPWPQVTKVGGE